MLDKQTCKLVSRITENLPDLDNETMQWLIEHPQELKKFLEGLRLLKNDCVGVKAFKRIKIFHFTEKQSIIYFSVDYDGMTINERIKFLEDKGFDLNPLLRSVLYSTHFNHDFVGTTNIALIKWTLFNDKGRTTRNIREHAGLNGFGKLNPAVAFFIRNQINDTLIREMCLDSIVVMHEPIEDLNREPSVLSINRSVPIIHDRDRFIDKGNECLLGLKSDNPEKKWGEMIGFAFAASQAQ